jgi:hypothetical protein
MEYTIEVPKMLLPEYPEPVITIRVSKVGGGTLGESYTGTWEYRVGYLGHRLIAGTDLITGTRKTHEQVARIIAGFLSSGEYDLPEDQQDRLSEFAEGE